MDKIYHASVGLVISLLAFWLSPLVVLLIIMTVATGKEVWDLLSKKGTPDVLDIVATIAGGLPIVIVMELIKYV